MQSCTKLIVTCFGDWLRIYLKTMGISDNSMCANLSNPANPFNPASLSNPANPSSLQITNLLLARGAGGRGEALRSAPTPQGVKGVPIPQMQFLRFSGSWGSGGVRPFRRPLPKTNPKVIKNRIKKKSRILTPNGLPKGPSKSQKSHQICKMAPSNPFRELFWPLPFQKGFPSRPQGPPEPQKS